LAFLFHKSALLFILAYFLNREFSTKYLIWLLLFVLTISFLGVINKLPHLFFLLDKTIGDKLNFYVEANFIKTNLLSSIFGLAKRSIWVILAIMYKNDIKNKDNHFNFFFNLYFVGLLIYILFNNTVLQVIVARGLLYFNVAEIFLIPYLFTVFKKGLSKTLVFILVTIYGLLLIEKGISFYKQDLGVDIYRPYNSVLLDNNYDAMKKKKN
jgi:hypothetical protein